MANRELAASIVEKLPIGMRGALALGIIAGLGSLDVAPVLAQESQESYRNTPVGVAVEAMQDLANGDIVDLKKLFYPTHVKDVDSLYGSLQGKHTRWMEVKPKTAHIVESWPAAKPYKGTKLVEMHAAHPTKGRSGLRGFCAIEKPSRGHWKVVLMGPEINHEDGECDVNTVIRAGGG